MSAGRAAGGSRRRPRAPRSRISRLRWWDGTALRGGRQGVTGVEIEEVLRWDPYLRGDGGARTLAYGTTGHGRALLVVLLRAGPHDLRVVAARDMTERERRAWRERPT